MIVYMIEFERIICHLNESSSSGSRWVDFFFIHFHERQSNSVRDEHFLSLYINLTINKITLLKQSSLIVEDLSKFSNSSLASSMFLRTFLITTFSRLPKKPDMVSAPVRT